MFGVNSNYPLVSIKKVLTIIVLLGVNTSCDKLECVKNASPNMIGEWVHLSEESGFHYIYIQSNGRGQMYGENGHGNNHDTQTRGWYIKENVLFFSRHYNQAESDQFSIDLYPTIATSQITTIADTVQIDDLYMILNNRVYRKIN